MTSNLRPLFAPALVGLLALTSFVLAAIPPIHNGAYGVSHLLQDDAYYYFVTANNFLKTGVFAFDGVNETNGFHPLWMAIVVALFKLCGAGCTQENQIFLIKTTEMAVRGIAVALCLVFYLFESRRRRSLGIGYLGIAIVLLCPAFVIFEQGMETTLAALFLILVINASSAGSGLRLGVWLALLFLTRLDTAVFVAAPLLVSLVLIERPRIRRVVAMTLPVTTLFAMYTGYNLWHTGHAVPISGAIRSSFPLITWHGGYLVEPIIIASMYGWRMLVSANILIVVVALPLGFVLLGLARTPADVRARILVIGIVAASLFANLLLFQKWEKSLDPRYLALPLVASVFFFAASLALMSERFGSAWKSRLRFSVMVLVAGLLALEAVVLGERFERDYYQTTDPVRELFQAVREQVPENAVIGGTDVGALAYWTGRRVVNLDGVINNWTFQDYVRDQRLADYLREQGVDHIATALTERDPTFTGRPVEPMYHHLVDPAATFGTNYTAHDYYVYSYVHHAYSDVLRLTPDQEVFRRSLGDFGGSQIAYVVYRIRR